MTSLFTYKKSIPRMDVRLFGNQLGTVNAGEPVQELAFSSPMPHVKGWRVRLLRLGKPSGGRRRREGRDGLAARACDALARAGDSGRARARKIAQPQYDAGPERGQR